jgi:hypothetical protein
MNSRFAIPPAKAAPSLAAGVLASLSDVPLLGGIPTPTPTLRKTKRLASKSLRRSPHPAPHHFSPLAEVDFFVRSRVAGRLVQTSEAAA